MNKLMISVFCSPGGSLRPGWRFAACAAYFLFAEYACSYLTFLFVPLSGSQYWFEAAYRPLLLISLLSGFGLILSATERAAQDPISAQGLSGRLPWLRQLISGCILGLITVSIAVLMVAVFGSYSLQLLSVDPAKILIVLWILFTSAAAEEVAFRGYPFQTLVRATGKWGAVLLMSALFGALHLNNPHASFLGILNTMLIGILLSLACLRTNGLWLPIGLHFGWNLSLGFIYGLPVSGVTFFSVLMNGDAAGPRWLTGADYGIEASLTGAAAICVGIVLVMLVTSQRSSRNGYTPWELSASNQGNRKTE